MQKKIIQITPTFPPDIGGIGYYSQIIGNALKKNKIKSYFFVKNTNILKRKEKKNIFFFDNQNRKLENSLQKYNCKIAILHFSGYGFAKRGLCFQLIKSLKKWKKNVSNTKLITIFHETFATGPIYRMSFWTSFLQKYLLKKLLKISDVKIATIKKNQLLLSSLSHSNKKVYLAGVFSNIGELKNKQLIYKKKIAIIFGNTSQKEAFYDDLSLNFDQYITILQKLSIEQIIDVGPVVKNLKNIGNLKVKTIGIKPISFLSNLFKIAKVGFVFYPNDYMGKSGVIASYASHGLLIVNLCQATNTVKNLFVPNVHYLNSFKKNQKINYEKIAMSSFNLYKKQNINKTVSLIKGFLIEE